MNLISLFKLSAFLYIPLISFITFGMEPKPKVIIKQNGTITNERTWSVLLEYRTPYGNLSDTGGLRTVLTRLSAGETKNITAYAYLTDANQNNRAVKVKVLSNDSTKIGTITLLSKSNPFVIPPPSFMQ